MSFEFKAQWAPSFCFSEIFNKTFSHTAPTFEASNDSMSELRATVGNSYKCSAEENFQVTDKALVNVFNVQVQAFKVDGDKFGAGKRFTFWYGGGGNCSLIET